MDLARADAQQPAAVLSLRDEPRTVTEAELDLGPPVLLTREQAAAWCQVGLDVFDQWTYEPGFPVLRRPGGHFVRIHRGALERWLELRALETNPQPLYRDPEPPRRRRRSA